MPLTGSDLESGPSSTSQRDPSPRSILVVDDDKGVRDLLCRWLQARGYGVASASNAAEALGLLETCQPAVALCDIRMPGRDGLWLADHIRQQFPATAVIMATGMHDAADAAARLGDGVIDYLTKPFDPDRLQRAVARGLQWHRSVRNSRSWREQLEAEVRARQERLANAIGTPVLHTDASLEAMFSLVTAGDDHARAHGLRVAALAAGIAERLNLPAAEVTTIRRAALLHDVGKLAIPESLVQKPAPLIPEELEVVRRCPELGARLVAALPGMEAVAEVIRDAQERLDGLGYPSGLRGPEVSVGARILAVANAFDTMVSRRIYRDAISVRDGLQELNRCCGTQFDPAVVAILEKQLVEW